MSATNPAQEKARRLLDGEIRPSPAEFSFLGPESQRVKIEIARTWNEKKVAGPTLSSTVDVYVQAGDQLFLDEAYSFLFSGKPSDVFFFDPISHYTGMAYRVHSSMALCALQRVPLCRRTVLDLGAGYGTLSLEALLRGSRQVLSVDNAPGMEQKFASYLGLNGFEGHGTFFSQDFTDSSFLASMPSADVDIVVANIGEGQYPSNPNRAAVALASQLPNVQYFVGAGYALAGPHQASGDIAALERHGFRVTSRFVLENSDPERQNVAFVAERT